MLFISWRQRKKPTDFTEKTLFRERMRADAQNTQNVVANWHAAQPRRKAAFKVKTIMGGEEFEIKKWLLGRDSNPRPSD